MSGVTWRPHFNSLKLKDGKQAKIGDEATKLLFKINKGSYFKAARERVVMSRSVRKIWIHRFRRENNSFVHETKSCRLGEFEKHLGINKTNRVIGFTPDFVGSRPSRVVKTHNFFTQHFIENFSELNSGMFSPEFTSAMKSSISESRIVYSGGYDTCDDHLRYIFKDNNDSINFDINTFFKDIERWGVCDWFQTPCVSFYDPKELLFNVRINEEANSGHYTSQLIAKTKDETTFVSRSVALKIYNLLKVQPVKNTYLWTLSKREKDIKVVGGDEPVSTRVVLFCEDPMTTLLMWFSQKILTGLNSCKNKFDISGEYSYSKAERIYARQKEFDWYIDTDWKFFDSNQDTKFIEAALLLCTAGLPDDKLHKNIRTLIVQSSVTKYVAVPPGIVVELNRSNASGHPFTTLLNCNVNVIYWVLIFHRIYGDNFKDFVDFEVYGDDGLIFFKEHPNLDFIDEIIKEIGLSSESIKGKFVPTNYEGNENLKPDFLKRRFNTRGISWNNKKMFDRFFYQVRKRDINEQIELLRSYALSARPSDDIHKYCVHFFNFISKLDAFKTANIDIVSNFRDQVINKKCYVEMTFNFTAYYDKYRYSDYVDKTMKLYGHAVCVFLPAVNLNSKYLDFIGSNDERTDILYYLLFDKNFITEKDNIYKVGRERMNIFAFNSNYVSDTREWCEGLNRGIMSYFGRIFNKL